jgi:hypothetical protein
MRTLLTKTIFTATLLLLNFDSNGAFCLADKRISESGTSTESLYRKKGLWYVPATANGKPVIAAFSTGSNYVGVNAPNLDRDFPDLTIEKGSDPSTGSVLLPTCRSAA